MDRKKILKRLVYLILFIFVIHLLATLFYWYFSIWYFDMIVHFLGGFWIGLATFYIFKPENISFNLMLKALLVVLLVGIGWELFEIVVNDVIAEKPINYLDTLSDICFDLSGGLCAILYLWKRSLK